MASLMTRNRGWIAALLVIVLPMAAEAVTVPNWQSPPAACLPGRMGAVDGCYCPPQSLCPSISGVASMQDFINNSNMPPAITFACCPLPTCPAGTDLAGEPLTGDGVCNRRCVGGPRDGQFLRDLDSLIPPQTCVAPEPPVWEPPDTSSGGGGDSGAGAGDGGDCLRSDSLVTLSNGTTKPISAIKIGDKLKGPEGDASVVSVNRTDGTAMYYRINDFKFAITGDHPIKTTKGWKAADDTMKYKGIVVGRLEVGDIIVTSAGEVEVKSITLEKTKKGTYSVNIKTEGDQSFFVDGVAIKPFKDINFTY